VDEGSFCYFITPKHSKETVYWRTSRSATTWRIVHQWDTTILLGCEFTDSFVARVSMSRLETISTTISTGKLLSWGSRDGGLLTSSFVLHGAEERHAEVIAVCWCWMKSQVPGCLDQFSVAYLYIYIPGASEEPPGRSRPSGFILARYLGRFTPFLNKKKAKRRPCQIATVKTKDAAAMSTANN
jgi:hypothetical protein